MSHAAAVQHATAVRIQTLSWRQTVNSLDWLHSLLTQGDQRLL